MVLMKYIVSDKSGENFVGICRTIDKLSPIFRGSVGLWEVV